MNIAGTADALNRQLHEGEAQALAEQLQQIKQDTSLTSLEKQNARYDAYAVVCYLTHCNAGIDSDSEQTQQLGQLKRHGEQLARQDSPVYLHFKAQQENNLFVYDGGWTGKDAWSDVFSSVDSSKVLAKFSPDYWQEHGIDNAAMSIYNAKDCPDVCISPVGALNTLEFYEPIAQELASTIVLLNESRLSAEQGEYLSALGFFTLASIDLMPGGKAGTGQVVKKVTARAGNAAKSTKLYRSVSEAELKQIQKTGRFEAGPNSLGGKFFAESADDAKKWGDAFGNSRIVEIQLPKNIADGLKRWERLDGIGPARYGELNQLQDAIIKEVK